LRVRRHAGGPRAATRRGAGAGESVVTCHDNRRHHMIPRHRGAGAGALSGSLANMDVCAAGLHGRTRARCRKARPLRRPGPEAALSVFSSTAVVGTHLPHRFVRTLTPTPLPGGEGFITRVTS